MATPRRMALRTPGGPRRWEYAGTAICDAGPSPLLIVAMPVLNHVCFREAARLVVLPQPGRQVAHHLQHPQHQAPALSP